MNKNINEVIPAKAGIHSFAFLCDFRIFRVLVVAVSLLSLMPLYGADENTAAEDPAAPSGQYKRQHVPLPAFKTTPNEGETYGLLYTVLFLDPNKRVYRMLAPSITYNDIRGTTGTFRLYGYPKDDERYFLRVAKSWFDNEDITLEYENKSLNHGLYRVYGRAQYFEDNAYRLYGIGPNTTDDDESDYTHREFLYKLFGGFNFADHFFVGITQRASRVDLREGGVDSIPETRVKHADVFGTRGWTTFAHCLDINFDNRPSGDLSKKGYYANMGYEVADKAFGSGVSFRRFKLETKAIFPLFNQRLLSVPRIQYERVFGKEVPFYEQGRLGGDLLFRGFGKGRWVDRTKLLFSLEERITVLSTKVMNVFVDWQMAPFIEYGTVVPHARSIAADHFELVYGVGFRAIVRPNIVGRVDIGKGGEGFKVFVSLGYPY